MTKGVAKNSSGAKAHGPARASVCARQRRREKNTPSYRLVHFYPLKQFQHCFKIVLSGVIVLCMRALHPPVEKESRGAGRGHIASPPVRTCAREHLIPRAREPRPIVNQGQRVVSFVRDFLTATLFAPPPSFSA